MDERGVDTRPYTEREGTEVEDENLAVVLSDLPDEDILDPFDPLSLTSVEERGTDTRLCTGRKQL